MVKRQLAQLKKARLASVEHFKKQKLEDQTHHTEQLRIDNQVRTSDTHNTDDTNDTEDTKEVEEEEETWFWHESANESESDTEDDGGYSDIEREESKTEEEAAPPKPPKKIHWDKKGEDNLRGFYGKGSLATLKRKKKAAKELEKEASKSYDIGALWQRNRNLGLFSQASTQSEQGEGSESCSGNSENRVYPLSQVPSGCTPLSQEESFREQRVIALKEITRLLELVIEQEKKYEKRLSPHGNFYRRHLMVQQFLQIQLRTQPSQTRRALSLSIAHSFGRGYGTQRNIVRWENKWVAKREIPQRKNHDDYSL